MDEFDDVGGGAIDSFDSSFDESFVADFPDMPEESFEGVDMDSEDFETLSESSELTPDGVSEGMISEEEFPDMPDELSEETDLLAEPFEGTEEEFPDMPEELEEAQGLEAVEEYIPEESFDKIEPLEEESCDIDENQAEDVPELIEENDYPEVLEQEFSDSVEDAEESADSVEEPSLSEDGYEAEGAIQENSANDTEENFVEEANSASEDPFSLEDSAAIVGEMSFEETNGADEMPLPQIEEVDSEEGFSSEAETGALDENDPGTIGEFALPSDPPNANWTPEILAPSGELAPAADSPYAEEWEEFAREYGTLETDNAWDALQEEPFAGGDGSTEVASEAIDVAEDSAAVANEGEYSSLSEYMNDHNYGIDDYAEYSKDPEWQRLHAEEFPDFVGSGAEQLSETEPLTPEQALDNMSAYMREHEYGIWDYAEYSKDPEWQALNRDLIAADDLVAEVSPTETEPQIVEETSETVSEDTFMEESVEIPETGPGALIETATEATYETKPDSGERFPGRVYDGFEQSTMEENPEFYETGEFYCQGINEYGYNGTCGPTSQANALNQLFDTNVFTENNILDTAVENNLCETSSSDPNALGGTNTEQFMELYEKVNEQTGHAFNVELYEFDNALDAEQVAERLDGGAVVNVAVDSDALWNASGNGIDPLGVPQQGAEYSDHWITVSGVQRDSSGAIAGFDIIDSGGGESSVSLEKYNEMCFGSGLHDVLDPTCVVVSRDQKMAS